MKKHFQTFQKSQFAVSSLSLMGNFFFKGGLMRTRKQYHTILWYLPTPNLNTFVTATISYIYAVLKDSSH